MNALTLRARYAAQARAKAQAKHQLIYRGQPCAQGHSGQRYTTDKHCVECRAARTKWGEAQHLNTIAAVFYEKEFDELGWNWNKLLETET